MIELIAHPREVLAGLRQLPRLKQPQLRSRGRRRRGRCEVCGKLARFDFVEIIPDDLAETWRLNRRMRRAFDRSCSMFCSECRMPYLMRQLARAIVDVFGDGTQRSLAELLEDEHFRAKRILQMDGFCLEKAFAEHPNYRMEPFIVSLLPSRQPACDSLPDATESLDLVLFAVTLEHIPDYERPLYEAYRVLKSGSDLICQLQIMMSRKTRVRATLAEDGSILHHLPPSFHCRTEEDSLVYVEFGSDTLELLERIGFRVEVYYYCLPADDYTYVLVCHKP